MDKKKVLSITVFIIGLVMLIVGGIFLIINLNKGSSVADGEYLVSAKNWVLDEGANCADEENCAENSAVIWDLVRLPQVIA